MSTQTDCMEMKATKKMDGAGTSVNMENGADAAVKGVPGDVKEKNIVENDTENEGILIEDGVIYDETDWIDDASDTKKDCDDQSETFIGKTVLFVQHTILRTYSFINKLTKGQLLTVILLLAFLAYFIAAMLHERLQGEHSIRLLWATILVIVIKTRSYWLSRLNVILSSANNFSQMSRLRFIIRWGLYLGLLVVMVYVLIEQGMKDLRNIQPVPGLIVMVLVCLFFSTAPSKINWHTIYWSISLQFICAVLVMRTDFGETSMLWIQNRFDEYFANIEMGAEFLFGETYKDHYLVFGTLPSILFSNATLCLLYYFGAIQLVIKIIGSFLEFVLDTSPVESSGVAGGIFLESVMAFLSLKPYLGRLTKSQLFLLTTSAYSSLGGAYIGMLMQLGVKVSDLIPAMLMSAPATFAVCKLIYPETIKKKNFKVDSSVNEERRNNSNVLEVVQNGAIQMVPLIGHMLAIVFVLYAFLSWINHTLGWFGDRVGVNDLNLEVVFSYLLYPISLCIGIEFPDCKRVATLMGYRIASGNIIAFIELTKMIENRNKFYDYMNQTDNMGEYTTYKDDIIIGNETLVLGFINERSERMITYALCGFSSILSVGMNIGIVATLIPRRKRWLSQLFMVSLIAGNLANCMTGAFAGIFYYE